MSIYNSQSPFNQGAKRSEITAANKQRRQSRRQRVKDIKEAGGPEFYSADGYHVGEFDKKGRNMQYPEKRYSKKDLSNPVEHHVESRIQKVSPMNQGDIKQAPSKLTQAYRRFKNDESGPYNMAKNIVTAAATLAPIPSLGKINAVKKISNLAKGKKRVGSIGGFKEFANPKLRNHFNPVKKSKPVDYMGPNPMHKSGAGGNSYPK